MNHDRDGFLREACAGDEDLRREVESLFGYEGGADAWIERPVVALAAPMLNNSASSALIDQGATPPLAAGAFDLPASIGPYKILRVLGEGGMGLVYLGEQAEPFRRQVALKVIKIAP